MRTCPDCQAFIDDQAVFCDNCGLRLTSAEGEVTAPPISAPSQPAKEAVPVSAPEIPPVVGETLPGTCSSCGYVNIPGEMFCQNCGVQLAPVASSPPPPPIPIPSAEPGIAQQVSPISQAQFSPDMCPSCGFVNPAGEIYCQNCGFLLASATAQPIAVPQVMAPSPPVEQAEPQIAAPPLEEVPPISRVAEVSKPMASPDTARPILVGQEQVYGKFVVKATNVEIPFPPGKQGLLIGRSDPTQDIYPDIDLSSYGGESGGVSRRHARLEAKGSNVYIEDLNSTNFTFLNRQKLSPGQKYLLQHGDEIRLGLMILQYFAD